MKEALFYTKRENERVNCDLCNHFCKIENGKYGTCGVRQNLKGTLYALNWGKVSGLAIDPIEKKPFYHYYPGSKVLSFGLPGCNFSCLNCQNCDLSQGLKRNKLKINQITNLEPQDFLKFLANQDILGIAYTYSEPTIFIEYVLDIISACKSDEKLSRLKHVFVSNGYFSQQLAEYLVKNKLIDAINIDLKFINDSKYRSITGGSLQPVLDNIMYMHENNIHVEIINLVIPGENDSDEDIKKIIDFVYKLDCNIPLHFNKFHPDYKMTDRESTPDSTLISACNLAMLSGLNHVYIGNTDIKGTSDSYCPKCKNVVISRKTGNKIITNYIIKNNKCICPECKSVQYIIQ